MNIHFIDVEEDYKIAFFPDSKRFLKINKMGKSLLSDIDNDRDMNDILKEYSIEEDEYNKYYNIVKNKDCLQKQVVNSDCTDNKPRLKRLHRLVLHLTNDCNLRCVYCYANGGTYLSNKGKLDSQTLDLILDRFYKEFDAITYIQFFGGEPLMNVPLLKEAMEKVRKIDAERNTTTNFGMVTNGTIVNQEIIDLIKEYNVGITISYDGNPIINNKTRVFPNGNGSTDVVLNNAKWLKRETNQPSTIEVTYNQYHVDNGVSVMDVVNHIKKEIPGIGIHIAPAGGKCDCDFVLDDLSPFALSVNDFYKQLGKEVRTEAINSYSLIDRIVNSLMKINEPGSRYVCPAGLDTLSVSINADVYPCFMFTDNDEFKLGNLADENMFKSDRFKQVINSFYSVNDKEINSDCKECFAKNVCTGCLGSNYLSSGDPYKLYKKQCDMTRNMLTAVLINQAKLTDKKVEESNVI